MVYIYVLKLAGDKWYVGKSADAKSRIIDHFEGAGSEWCKLHKPLKLEALFTSSDPFDEDLFVKRYMAKYGIDNVRGGSYVKLVLTPTEKSILKREIASSKDACFICGVKGHFARDCPNRNSRKNKKRSTQGDGSWLNVVGTAFSWMMSWFENDSTKSKDICYRCNKRGHWAKDCLK